MATVGESDFQPLLKSQKNVVFGWVVEAGFGPGAFTVNDVEWNLGVPCTRFGYQGTEYFCEVMKHDVAYSIRYSPGASEVLKVLPDQTSDFERLRHDFEAWLGYLRREVESPDLWALARGMREMFDAPPDASHNTPFEEGEIRLVEQGVESARTYLLLEMPDADLGVVDAKLDYLIEAAHSARRFDWFQIAFSIVWSLMVSVNLDAAQAQTVFNLILSGLRNLLSAG